MSAREPVEKLAKLLDPIERFLLLLLYSKKEEAIRGDTWLQKEMFLVGKNVDEIGRRYEAYLKGPYSELVDKSARQFERSGYVARGPGASIMLTNKGSQLARRVWDETNDEVKKMVEDIKDFLNDMTSDELLVFIYTSYPETTENSDIKEEVEARRRHVALNLVRKGKISVEKGAEVAGMKLEDFIRELRPVAENLAK